MDELSSYYYNRNNFCIILHFNVVDIATKIRNDKTLNKVFELYIFRDFMYVFLISGAMLIIVVIERVAIFITNTKSNAAISEVI